MSYKPDLTRCRLVALACSFFMGHQFEDIGVVTEPEFRGRGFSTACAGALCQDIREQRRSPSWTTSPDNIGSLRVAEKLGFEYQYRSRLYVCHVAIPRPDA
jgi:RimJ/RimL family protein N-acetyltransferase